ncbi:MAG TPA: histidine phosphatase family protein [Chloroflexota bacterium]|nr:histidine phosphatase family protein [Chloroflexota bacterium]
MSHPSLRLLLARHGETVWNREGRYQGQRDSALTERGEAQARCLATRLADESIAVAYASDLRRAWQTAEVIAAGRNLSVTRDASWREMSYGAWEGLTRAEIQERFPDAWQRRLANPAGIAPPGGESPLDLQRRVVGALHALAERHPGQSVLVVTHGGALRALACWLFDVDLNDPASSRLGLTNCGLSCVRYDGAAWQVDCWNDVSHLDGRP